MASISESPPEKRAPGLLGVVQRFVNSADLETGEEELETPAALVRWLRERDLIGPGARATQEELDRAKDVREGLRATLQTHNGGGADAGALARLDRAAGRAVLRPAFGGATPRLVPAAKGVDGALAELLGIVAVAAADGSWRRMKACADDGCRWAFFDRTKNRSGRWCSMAVCGNQQKARAFRERAKSDDGPPGKKGRT